MYDYPSQQDDDDGCHLNPHNRFLLIFCHASDVSEGWGCVMCGGRTFSFKCGVVIFSIVMAVGAVNDFIGLIFFSRPEASASGSVRKKKLKK